MGDFPAYKAAQSGQRFCAGSLAARHLCGCSQPLGGDQQAIPSPGQRLDVLRVISSIAQSIAQRSPENPDGHVNAVVEIHNGVAGPEHPLDFLAGYDLAAPLNQHSQNLEWLFPKKDFAVTIHRPERAQFTGIEVKFKPSEPDATCETLCHGRYDSPPKCTTVLREPPKNLK